MQKKGYTPAIHVHGLAFGATFPDMQRKFPITCLGASTQMNPRRDVMCPSSGDLGRRYLEVHSGLWDGDWGVSYCRLPDAFFASGISFTM
jgi:hypothetical protein